MTRSQRVELGAYVAVPLQDHATIAHGIVVAADEKYFTVRLETLFPGAEMTLEQGDLGVEVVADG